MGAWRGRESCLCSEEVLFALFFGGGTVTMELSPHISAIQSLPKASAKLQTGSRPTGQCGSEPNREGLKRFHCVCVCVCVRVVCFPFFPECLQSCACSHTHMWYIGVLFTPCYPLVTLPFTTNFPPSPPAATKWKKMTPLLQPHSWVLRKGLDKWQFLF